MTEFSRGLKSPSSVWLFVIVQKVVANGAKPPKSILITIVSDFLLCEVSPEHPKRAFKRKQNRQ